MINLTKEKPAKYIVKYNKREILSIEYNLNEFSFRTCEGDEFYCKTDLAILLEQKFPFIHIIDINDVTDDDQVLCKLDSPYFCEVYPSTFTIFDKSWITLEEVEHF